MPGSGICLDFLDKTYDHLDKELVLTKDMQIKRLPLSWVINTDISGPLSLNYYNNGMKTSNMGTYPVIDIEENKIFGTIVTISNIELSKLITSNRKYFGYELGKIKLPEWASELESTIRNIIDKEYENSD